MPDRPIKPRDIGEDVATIRAIFYPGVVGLLMGAAAGSKAGHPFLGILLVFGGAGYLMNRFVVGGSARAFASAVVPDARGGVGVGYSHIEALEAKGDIAGALVAWEAAIAASPTALAARINGADLHARNGQNAPRAAELFREVSLHSDATPETQRYATQRLIDLLLGPLRDEGRALVELRRLVDRWPDTPEGKGARTAIARIKAERGA